LEERRNRLRLDAANQSLLIHQDAAIYLSTLKAEQQVSHELAAGRHAWDSGASRINFSERNNAKIE